MRIARRPTGQAALDGVVVIHRPAVVQEIMQPAFAAGRSGFPHRAGERAAIPKA